MSKKSTVQVAAPTPWYRAWWLAITRPFPDAYRDLITRTQRPIRIAILWMVIIGLIGGFVWLIGYMTINFRNPTMTQLPPSVFTLPLIGIGAISLYFTALAGIPHLGAKVFRGKGRFADVLYLKAAHLAPLVLLALLLTLILPRSMSEWIALPLLGIQLGLNLPMLKATHNLSTRASILVGILITALALVGIGAAIYYSGYRLEFNPT